MGHVPTWGLLTRSMAAAVSLTVAAVPANVTPAAPLWPYSPEVTRAFAALTQASYCDEAVDRQKLLTWDCPECASAGFRLVQNTTRFISAPQFWEQNATFAYVARIQMLPNDQGSLYGVGDGCVLSVRGSETFTNWMKNMEVWSVPADFPWCKGCKVETGFYSITTQMMTILRHELRSIGCVPEAEVLP